MPASLVGIALALPLVAVAAVKLSRAVYRERDSAYVDTCLANLAELGAAVEQYTLDHEGRVPPSATWADATLRVLGREQPFCCPSDPSRTRNSYAFNDRLTAGTLGEVENAHDVPMIYDSRRGSWNARDAAPEFCLPPRHGVYNNAVMADGSARSFASYDAWAAAQFRRGTSTESEEVEALPAYDGPTLLYGDASGLRAEYPSDWQVQPVAGGVRFGPADRPAASCEIMVGGASVESEPAEEPLPPQAQVVATWKTSLAPLAGEFPVTCDVREYTYDGRRVCRLSVPTQPPLRVAVGAPESEWESLRPALFVPVVTLRLPLPTGRR